MSYRGDSSSTQDSTTPTVQGLYVVYTLGWADKIGAWHEVVRNLDADLMAGAGVHFDHLLGVLLRGTLDVDGIRVSGIIRLKGNITISPFENNLIYRVYDLGGVELSVGPINVESVGLGAPGTFEKAIDPGNILTNTTVRITVEDINVKDGSLFAMDSVVLQVR